MVSLVMDLRASKKYHKMYPANFFKKLPVNNYRVVISVIGLEHLTMAVESTSLFPKFVPSIKSALAPLYPRNFLKHLNKFKKLFRNPQFIKQYVIGLQQLDEYANNWKKLIAVIPKPWYTACGLNKANVFITYKGVQQTKNSKTTTKSI